jgi:hypothetical protein
MRRRTSAATALPAAAVLVALCTPLVAASPALAQPVTTPIPAPADPGQPPVSAPSDPPSLAHAIGDAGTGLGVVRIAPDSVQTSSILPGFGEELPKQSAAEIGVGLASAQANTEAFLAHERAVAQASPLGFAVQGRAPQTPGSLVQAALPDNPEPLTGGLTPPRTPLDALLKVGLLDGSVQARWNEQLGPCVEPLADARTSVASLSVLNAIPTLPSGLDLTGLLIDNPKLDAATKQAVIDGVKSLSAPLSQLGGLLSGTSETGDTGSLLSVPETFSARSTVRLVDLPGSANKAVESTSTLQAASVRLLAGTPLEVRVDVVSQPTLTALSTGDEATSAITYTAPVLRISQGGRELGVLDASHPQFDVPIAVPLPGAPGLDGLPKLPIVGDLLPSGAEVPATLPTLDLGVLRLQIAQLDEKRTPIDGPLVQGGPPITGYMLGGTARLLDLQLLPTDALSLPNLPSALAQVSLGEQIVRAAAPRDGVVCAAPPAPQPGAEGPAPQAPAGTTPPTLAYTNAAYKSIPLFWAGTAMLLAGVVIVAAMPGRRRPLAVTGPVEEPDEQPAAPAEDSTPEDSTPDAPRRTPPAKGDSAEE